MRKLLLVLGLVLGMGAACPAVAHEIAIKPGTCAATVGKAVPFGVHSAHVFIVSEELETPADVKAFAVTDGKPVEVKLTPDAKTFVFNGQATFAKPGAGLILVHRLPQVWSLTPEGMKKGTKKDLPGATKSNSYEKFAKAIVSVGGSDAGFDAVVGQKLELVPLTDPAKVKVGQDMDVKVLLDGKPTPAVVLATYDGFTKNPNSYAYYTETGDDGVAKVRITHPGLWMVRTEMKGPSADKTIDREALRSTLTFCVR
ncbi:Nickel transport complex, NikM subunit, transmembrane [Solidesulfovibrio fructosivorans JJ]]|uniref:Nickel transport complex, NikM subunit, transmembrane n=1 Tax=Solidesulfovibrio fructosivorans JJ] TaxID=596151 RepID=E1JYK2_SOLFR|nr:DUF4198 domain-containing protein [Solidesulfovibrio fructosivorans]EFL50586.1 Nickel transport complex, NikM subunit, transmembrane [Solidesulfovibrio fructosivorans JJ]]